MFANSNELSALGKDKVQLTDNDQFLDGKSEYDWYSWIDHLISLEYHKAIEELKADISELEAEVSELKVLISELTHPVERRCQEKLKDDMEIDLTLVKCLYQYFYNPEEIITELKQHIDKDKSRKSNGYISRASNRINGHIILVKYFIEETVQKVSAKTMAFMQDIENQDRNQKKRNSWTGREPKKEIESVYTASDKNTAKEYDEVAYDQKLEELRDLIIYAKNNFDDDVYARLLIRVNNCILSNSQHFLNGKNSDLIVNPDDFDYKGTLFFNKKVSNKTQEAFTHAEKLRDCVKELLKINHGNFDQIFGDIKDLMKPVLKQSDEASNPSVNPLQNPQAEPNAKKVRNISDIFQISKAHYSFESYESGQGIVELSEAEIDFIKKDIAGNVSIKAVGEVRMRLAIALDNLDLEKYVSEGKIEVLEKYLDVIEQYFKITADILVELDQKKELYAKDLVEKKRERIKKILNKNAQSQSGPETNGDAENETQKESEQPQQRAQSADNKGFGKEIMSVVGAIVGAIIGATIAYLAGATTLPIIAAIAVISAVPGVLIGYGIAEICEKVSKERQNVPNMGILTALSIVLTPKCLSDNDVVNPSLGTSRGA